jgi:predicted negative regulator of RcsB-dependent stress response
VIAAAIGFVVAVVGWRFWTASKRRSRIAQSAAFQSARE